MSKNPAKRSGAASGRQGESFVYDFLYHDARRVGSFLAQLGPYGHLTGLEHTNAASSESSSLSKLEGGVDVPLVAKAGGALEHHVGQGTDEGLSRTYDPFWTNALDLFEKLDAADLVQRDITKAGLGQFVLVTGSLAVVDLKLVKDAWKEPSIRKAVGQGEPDYTGMTKEQRAKAKHDHQAGIALMLDLLPLLPHVVQGSLRTGNQNVWISLDDNWMVSSAAEIVLRHGAVVKGQWHMLGILDATPAGDDEPALSDGTTPDQIGAMNAFGTTALGQLGVLLAPVIRTLMGRPDHHYAVTPVMIFRETTL